jgi:sulfatase modifying factor 1
MTGPAVRFCLCTAVIVVSHILNPAEATEQGMRDCAVGCPAMMHIPGGQFEMGAASEEEAKTAVPADYPMARRGHSSPQHVVHVSQFYIGRYDITRGEFGSFVRATGYTAGKDCSSLSRKLEYVEPFDWRGPGLPQTERDPVVCVNWKDAQVYLAWLSRKTGHVYRLPTEAEWEYAARAGSSGYRYWRAQDTPCKYANGADETLRTHSQPSRALKSLGRDSLNRDNFSGCSDGYSFTSPVGSYAPNSFGLYDMLGNVEQWVQDCWNPNYNGAPSNGGGWFAGNCKERVARGGSWYSPPWQVRAAYRFATSATFRFAYCGFRAVREDR